MSAKSQALVDSFQVYSQQWVWAAFWFCCSVVNEGSAPAGDSHWAVVVFLVQEAKGFGAQKISLSESQVWPIAA